MKIAIAGMGLIGGSLFKAAHRAGIDAVGFDRGDTIVLDGAQVVFVALPPESIVPWIREHAAAIPRGAVVVDVCGMKSPVMDAMKDFPRDGWTFVGGHPMAGREVSGFANAIENLFDGASMILTPFPDTPPAMLDDLRALFAKLGFGRVVVTDPAHHDEMIAFTSQLCHVIATAYSRDAAVAHAPGFSAGSYANMTRIATMDPTTWSALYLENRPALLAKLDGLIARLGEFRNALAAEDRPELMRIISEGADAKRRELGANR